jgi:hypothetical protein
LGRFCVSRAHRDGEAALCRLDRAVVDVARLALAEVSGRRDDDAIESSFSEGSSGPEAS